ncbi:MAG: hypothetical protein LIO37_01490 [Clostridiales bacterium]|nr:hypothetical protein [Clostridiales bacterium]
MAAQTISEDNIYTESYETDITVGTGQDDGADTEKIIDTDEEADAEDGADIKQSADTEQSVDTEEGANTEQSADTEEETDTDAWIQTILDELDLSELEDYVGTEVSEKISFEDLVNTLLNDGFGGLDVQTIATWVFDIFFYELATAKEYFLQMLVFTAVFAVFKQILDMRSRYISEVTFLMVCSAMMAMLISSFSLIAEVAQAAITRMVTYLSVLVPVYATVLLVSGNGVSAGAFYELSFLIMTLLEWAMRVLFVPGIHIFLMLSFLNELFDEAKLSRMAQLLESGIRSLMKAGLGAVVGIGVIQSLLTPAQDRLTESAVLSSLSALPGIGSLAGSAGDILLSCGMLIKNSVGVAALIVLVVISVVPVVKVFLFLLLYRLLAAIMQPITDHRIVNCIHATSLACDLYLLLLRDGMMMFFLQGAMVTASSSFIF